MTPKERAAMQQALEAFRKIADLRNLGKINPEVIAFEMIYVMREALDHSGEATEMVQPVSQEPEYFGLTHDHTWLSIDKKQYDKLKPEGRMACYTAPQPVSQEPVGVVTDLYPIRVKWLKEPTINSSLYTAPQPVKEVDLTDDEIDRALDAASVPELPAGYESVELEIARTVIAKYKEKNK